MSTGKAVLGCMGLSLALGGCDWLRPAPTPSPAAEQIDPAATATPEYTPPPPTADTATPEPASFPVADTRAEAPMVDGCEDTGPNERPEGSNCYGFYPEQCAADRAAGFLGRTATPELRDRIRDLAPRGKARFVLPGERTGRRRDPGRLTVDMTQSGKITRVDCY